MNVALTKMMMRGVRIDYAKPLKKALLEGQLQKIDTKPAKIARALKLLGKKWVCHKSNRVTKLAEPLPDNFVMRKQR